MADRFADDQPRYFSGVVPAVFRDLLAAGQVFWENGGIKKDVLDLLFGISERIQKGRVGVGKMAVPVYPDDIIGLRLQDGGEKFLFVEQLVFGLLQLFIVSLAFFERRFEHEDDQADDRQDQENELAGIDLGHIPALFLHVCSNSGC